MKNPPYIELIGDAFDTVNVCGTYDEFVAGFSRCSEPVQNMLALVVCMGDVQNGGLHQFLSNSMGMVAPEAAAGFRAIGLPAVGEVLEDAMRRFGEPFPRDRDERQRRLYGMDAEGFATTAFDELTERFNEWMDERFEDAANSYALRQMANRTR